MTWYVRGRDTATIEVADFGCRFAFLEWMMPAWLRLKRGLSLGQRKCTNDCMCCLFPISAVSLYPVAYLPFPFPNPIQQVTAYGTFHSWRMRASFPISVHCLPLQSALPPKSLMFSFSSLIHIIAYYYLTPLETQYASSRTLQS